MAIGGAHGRTLYELDDTKALLAVTSGSVSFLRAEMAAIRDIAFRGSNDAGARDAVEAVFVRASKALETEANR